MKSVKVLSVRQPWAWLIFNGKDIENRTWKTDYRGKLYIHGSLKRDIPENCSTARYIFNSIPYEERNNISFPDADHPIWEYGAIIGSVELVGCVRDHKSKWAMPNYWHWVLENPTLLDKPIPCKGQLRIFNFKLSIKAGESK